MITKRVLGIGLALLGTLAILALFARDMLRASEFRGIGPLQQIALWVAGAMILLGITLIPLGDRPA
ncbi:MAG: hypothetical protein AAF633_05770 [Chloroflexota bacterium]